MNLRISDKIKITVRTESEPNLTLEDAIQRTQQAPQFKGLTLKKLYKICDTCEQKIEWNNIPLKCSECNYNMDECVECATYRGLDSYTCKHHPSTNFAPE